MAGLLGWIVLIAYILAGREIIKRLQTKKAKFIFVAVYLLIPIGDVFLGHIYFYSLCVVESGQKIYKTVELSTEYFLQAGDLDQSRRDEWGKYPIAKGGELNQLKLKERYSYTSKYDKDYSKIFHITKVYGIVQDEKTNQILGDATSFVYRGGWLENIVFEFPSGRWCPTAPTDIGYIHSTLEERIFKHIK
jgi:hypothetical protein